MAQRQRIQSACNVGDAGDVGLILGLGKSPLRRNGNSLQYSCLGNSMDRGAWWATAQEVTKIPGLQGGVVIKEFTCNAGDARDASLTPGSGRFSGVGSGNPLQYSCLENFMDRGACWAVVRRVSKSQT